MASPLAAARAARDLRTGQHALAAGDAAHALAALESAARLRPRWASPRLWLGLALSELEQVSAALAALDEAERLSPGGAVQILFRCRVLLDAGRAREAVAAAEGSRERAPDNVHVHGYLALARWVAGDVPSGRALPRRADEVGGGAELWGRWLLAVEERFPGGAGIDYPAPRAAVGLAERLASWRAARRVARARVLLASGHPTRAASVLDGAEGLWPGDEDLLALRVEVHRASAVLRAEALAEASDQVDLRLAVAEDFLEIGEPGAALGALAPVEGLVEAIDRGRLSWRATCALLEGRALLERGEVGQAAARLETAAALWPVEAEPLYYLGVARLRLGERPAARRAFIAACCLDGGLGLVRLRELSAAEGG